VFVALSKLLDLLLGPLTWALLLALVAALLVGRRPGLARGLLALSLGVLAAFSSGPVANALARASEAGVRDTSREGEVYDAVILLGGGLDAAGSERSGQPEYNDAPERLMRTFELLRAGRARAVLVTGGALFPRPGVAVEAEVLAAQLRLWGIAPERIVVEGASRNTRENALHSVELVRQHGWRRLLLVTSANHMPRALGCFRAVGLEPDVLPVDFRAPVEGGLAASDLLPRASHLDRSTDVLRELAGRVVYRLQGYAR
jgi:uncharacterized SAM-binding protein YcdF (DUF218 family)